MKRTVATVGLVCALMIGCMGMPPVRAAESDTDKVTTDIGTKVMPFEELSVEVVDSMSIPSMTRATSRIEWNISPDTVMKADTAYSLEADEIVTINCIPQEQPILTLDSSLKMIRSISPVGVMEVSKPTFK